MSAYRNTQKSPIHLVLALVAVIELVAGALLVTTQPFPGWILLVVGALMLLATMMFRTLTVEDGGSELRVGFGPLPFVKTSVPFDAIRSFAPGRSSLIDGLDVHYLPGRGWIWNLWGFDCVELEIEGRSRLRIGTDDVTGLMQLLQERVPS